MDLLRFLPLHCCFCGETRWFVAVRLSNPVEAWTGVRYWWFWFVTCPRCRQTFDTHAERGAERTLGHVLKNPNPYLDTRRPV